MRCNFQLNCKQAKNICNTEFADTCIRGFKLSNLFNNSLLSSSQFDRISLRIDADGSDKEAFLRLKEISVDIENFVRNGDNLYIYSERCGNGKTAWSIRLMQDYFYKIWPYATLGCHGLFIHVPKFLISLKESITEHSGYIDFIKENIERADIVVFDEIGTKVATEFEHENLLNYINNRISNKKCNIFTSNLSPNELVTKIGDRLYSRIITGSRVEHFVGKDKRGIK